MLRFLLILSLLVAFTSCSASKQSKDVGEDEQGVEVSDADEFLEEDGDEMASEDSEEAEEALEEEGEEDLFAEDAPVEEEALEEEAVEEVAQVEEEPAMEEESVVEADQPVQEASAPVQYAAASGPVETYTVQEGETLMMISFKLYGDYLKWREISHLNSDIITDGQTVSAGMQIKYSAPSEAFVFNPTGNPYLIKWGDTLGKISNNVYGEISQWKQIWKNNEPLIKNPNKIYAGFTIFTPEKEEQAREVANEEI